MKTASLPLPLPAKETIEQFARGVYHSSGRQWPYRFFTPKNLGRDDQIPLVVFFHGAFERGHDNLRQLNLQTAPMVFVTPEVQEHFPCFVLAPQCPEEMQWVDMPWDGDRGDQPAEPSMALAVVEKLIRNLMRIHPQIDPGRIVATGFSMGGYGVFDALIRWPDLFAAGMAVCGGGDESKVGQLVGKPLWIFHSEDDQIVPVNRSRNMVAAIRAAGGSPSYTEYAASMGLLHLSWNEAFLNTPGLFSFLLGPERDAPPQVTVQETKALGIGIIGTGVIVRDYHLKAINDYPERFKVVALHNRTRASAEKMATGFEHQVAVCDSADELLSREDVDAVLVAVPPFLLSEFVIKALRAGKHVLSEKPMGNTAADALTVLEAAKTSAGRLMVAENYLFHPVIQKLIQIARMAKWPYGKPILVELHQFWKMTPQSIPQFYHSSWRHDPRLTYGYLIEGGCHTTNPIREMFGMPSSIHSHLLSADPALGRHDTCIAHCKLEDGTACQITMSYGMKSPDGHLLKIYATDGSLFVEGSSLGTIDEDGMNILEIPKVHPSGYHAEWVHFYDICRGADSIFTPQQSYDDILFMQMLIDQAPESSASV